MVDRGWLRPERRRRFGLYDQLIVELQREGEGLFVNFMRMPPEMFDELLLRVGTPHNQANLIVPRSLGAWTETGTYTETFGARCKLPQHVQAIQGFVAGSPKIPKSSLGPCCPWCASWMTPKLTDVAS